MFEICLFVFRSDYGLINDEPSRKEVMLHGENSIKVLPDNGYRTYLILGK